MAQSTGDEYGGVKFPTVPKKPAPKPAPKPVYTPPYVPPSSNYAYYAPAPAKKPVYTPPYVPPKPPTYYAPAPARQPVYTPAYVPPRPPAVYYAPAQESFAPANYQRDRYESAPRQQYEVYTPQVPDPYSARPQYAPPTPPAPYASGPGIAQNARALFDVLRASLTGVEQATGQQGMGAVAEMARRVGPDLPGAMLSTAAQSVGQAVSRPVKALWEGVPEDAQKSIGGALNVIGQKLNVPYEKLAEPWVAKAWGERPEVMTILENAQREQEQIAAGLRRAGRHEEAAQATEKARAYAEAIRKVAYNTLPRPTGRVVTPTTDRPTVGEAAASVYGADQTANVERYRSEATPGQQLLAAVLWDPLNAADIGIGMGVDAVKLIKGSRIMLKTTKGITQVAQDMASAGERGNNLIGRLTPFRLSNDSLAGALTNRATDMTTRMVEFGDPDLFAKAVLDPDAADVVARTGGLSQTTAWKQTAALTQKALGANPTVEIQKLLAQNAGNPGEQVASLAERFEGAARSFFPAPAKHLPTKIRDQMRNSLSQLYMGYSPGYAIKNFEGNTVTALADGVSPFATKASVQAFESRWGTMPVATRQGIGMAGEGLKGSAAAGAIRQPALGAPDVLKAGATLKSPMLQVAQTTEQWQSQAIVVNSLKRWWGDVWPTTVRERLVPSLQAAGLDPTQVQYYTRQIATAANPDELRRLVPASPAGAAPPPSRMPPAGTGPVAPVPPVVPTVGPTPPPGYGTRTGPYQTPYGPAPAPVRPGTGPSPLGTPPGQAPLGTAAVPAPPVAPVAPSPQQIVAGLPAEVDVTTLTPEQLNALTRSLSGKGVPPTYTPDLARTVPEDVARQLAEATDDPALVETVQQAIAQAPTPEVATAAVDTIEQTHTVATQTERTLAEFDRVAQTVDPLDGQAFLDEIEQLEAEFRGALQQARQSVQQALQGKPAANTAPLWQQFTETATRAEQRITDAATEVRKLTPTAASSRYEMFDDVANGKVDFAVQAAYKLGLGGEGNFYPRNTSHAKAAWVKYVGKNVAPPSTNAEFARLAAEQPDAMDRWNNYLLQKAAEKRLDVGTVEQFVSAAPARHRSNIRIYEPPDDVARAEAAGVLPAERANPPVGLEPGRPMGPQPAPATPVAAAPAQVGDTVAFTVNGQRVTGQVNRVGPDGSVRVTYDSGNPEWPYATLRPNEYSPVPTAQAAPPVAAVEAPPLAAVPAAPAQKGDVLAPKLGRYFYPRKEAEGWLVVDRELGMNLPASKGKGLYSTKSQAVQAIKDDFGLTPEQINYNLTEGVLSPRGLEYNRLRMQGMSHEKATREVAARLGDKAVPAAPPVAPGDALPMGTRPPAALGITGPGTQQFQGAMQNIKAAFQSVRSAVGTPQPMTPLSPQQAAALRQVIAQEAIPALVKDKAIVSNLATTVRNFILGDYSRRRNIIDWLSYVYPYPTWYGFTYWNWAQRLATHPSILANYARLKGALYSANEEWYRNMVGDPTAELPPQYQNVIRMGNPENPLLVNLERSLNPLNALTEDFNSKTRSEAPYGKEAQAIGQYGPTPYAPYIWAYAAWLKSQGYDEAAQEWWGYLSSTSKAIKSATALYKETGGPGSDLIPAGGYAPEQTINKLTGVPYVEGGDIYERRRIGQYLAEMYRKGEIDATQLQNAAYLQSGPLWEKARQAEAVANAGRQLASWGAGLAVDPFSDVDKQMAQMWAASDRLAEMKRTMPPDSYEAFKYQFEAEYPWAAATKGSYEQNPAERQDAYAGAVLDRLPPGRERTALLAAAGIAYELYRKFYDDGYTTANMTEAERAQFEQGIAKLGADVPVPTAEEEYRQTTVGEWQQRLLAQAAGQVNMQLSTNYTVEQLQAIEQGYYAEGVDTKAYLAAHPELSAYWDAKSAVSTSRNGTGLMPKLPALLQDAGVGPGELPGFLSGQPAVPALAVRSGQDQFYTSPENLAAREMFGDDILDLQNEYMNLDETARKAWARAHPTEYELLKDYWDWKREQAGEKPYQGSGGSSSNYSRYSRSNYSGSGGSGYTRRYTPRTYYRRTYYPRTYYRRSYSSGSSRSYGGGGGYSGGYSGGGGGGALPGATPTDTGLLDPNTGALPGGTAPLQFVGSTGAQFETLYTTVSAYDPAFTQLVGLLFGSGIADLMRKWYTLTPEAQAAWQLAHAEEYGRLQRFFNWLVQQQTAGADRNQPFTRQLESMPNVPPGGTAPAPLLPPPVPPVVPPVVPAVVPPILPP